VRTGDGVLLRGLVAPAALPDPLAPGARAITFVVAHGFTNSIARPSFGRVVGWLRRFGEVRAVDFRGHGASGGASSVGGDLELADLDAAVDAARADGADAVVTLGLSMGGGVALRHPAVGRHRPDALVSVS
jgi:alpha-beta hydrolase superfamily lysophospholipase